MIILIFKILISTEGKIYEIDSPGILFQQIGNIYIQENIWKVKSKLNLQNYTQELENLHEYKQFILKLTETIRNNNNETIVLDLLNLHQEFQTLINSIQEINNLILNENDHIRQTRSIFPSIGTIFHETFGLADEDIISDIKTEQLELSKQDIQLGYAIKNNTIITEKLLEQTKNNMNTLNTEIEIMISTIKTLANKQDDSEIRNQILLTAQIMTLIVIRYTKFQNYLLESLLSNEPTHINLQFIPYTVLKEIIKLIEEKMDNTQMLPYRLLPNNFGLSMYKLFPIRTKIHKQSIIFDISIPTITRNKKILYSVYSAPTKTNSTLSYIEPKSAFIILNKIKNEIGYLTEQEFKKCFKMRENEYLCSEEIPFYTKLSKQCELEIINNENFLKHV